MESPGDRDHSSDAELKRILQQAQAIAVVGHSPKPERPSYQIAQFLRRAGYRVIPVHPAVTDIDGERCYPSLEAVPEPIDIANVFRNSQHLPALTKEAAALGIPVVWAQLGIIYPLPASPEDPTNPRLIVDTCIKIEFLRLGVKR